MVSELDACNLRAVDSTHVSNICSPTFRSQEKLIIDSSATAVFSEYRTWFQFEIKESHS